MSNSDRFYTLIREFQEKRQNASDVFDREMAELKRYVGSEFYETESKAAADRRDMTLNELQAEYRMKLDEVLRAMVKANAEREMKPPTDAELRLLQVLKMKDHLDEAELKSAARSLRGNPVCLDVLGEIGRQHGYAKTFAHYGETKTLGIESTANVLATLAKNTEDFLRHDTRRSARLVQAYRQRNFGNPIDDAQLPKRRPIRSKEQAFEELGMLNADSLESFFNTVDGMEDAE